MHAGVVSRYRNPASARVRRRSASASMGTQRAHVVKWGEAMDVEAYGFCVGSGISLDSKPKCCQVKALDPVATQNVTY